MINQPLDALNDTPATSTAAPGQSVPVWLYRRALYLLAAETTPVSARALRRIRNDLLNETAIRIPEALLNAIVTTYREMNDYTRNRIHNFTEAQMQPDNNDFQIQTETNVSAQQPHETPQITQPATRPSPRQRSPPPPPPKVSDVRTRLPSETNERVPPITTNNEANEIRRQRYPGARFLRGLEIPRPASTLADRAIQRRLGQALRDRGAADIIGDLQGPHVQPTDNYLAGTESHPLLQDEQGMVYHAPLIELRSRQTPQAPSRRTPPPRPNLPGTATNMRRSPRNRPATSNAAGATPSLPTGRTAAATRPRATKILHPVESPPRETRATKRKRDGASAARNEQVDDEHPHSNKDKSDEEAPPTKKPRITVKIDLKNKRITKGGDGEAEHGSAAPMTPRKLKLIISKKTPPKLTLTMCKPMPEPAPKPTRRTRKQSRDDKQEDGDGAQIESGGNKSEPATVHKTTRKSRKRTRKEEEEEGDKNGGKDNAKRNNQAKRRRKR